MRTNSRRALTPLALAVLELLHERPRHPYDIHQTFHDRHTDMRVKVRAGSLYHTVERLADQQLIEPVETSRAGRRPERTVYSITEQGRDEFAMSVRSLVGRPAPEYPVFGAALACMHTIGQDDSLDQLRRRATALDAEIAAWERIAASLTERSLPDVFWVDLRYRLALHRAELTFVNDLITRISAGDLPWPPVEKNGDQT
jgi:DNA-binding PadR family transcriptional regulator